MKALLIVDMQNGFMQNEKYKLLSKKIERLANSNYYDRIFATKFINDRNKNPFYQDKLGWQGLTTKEEQAISFDLPKDAIVFKKNTYGLKQKDLNFIKSLNLQQIDICGVEAESCIHAIAFQLWDVGIFPNVLVNYMLGNVDMRPIYVYQFGKVDDRE